MAALQARLGEPAKTPDTSSLPPSKGHTAKRTGPRQGSLGRSGGGRPLARDPDQVVTAKPKACVPCGARLDEGDQMLHAVYDRIDLPPVRPIVARVERSADRCR